MKKSMRCDIISRRDKMTMREIKEKSHRIKNALFSTGEFVNSGTVLFYVSFGNEVYTKDMIEESMGKGIRVLVPVTVPETRSLIPSEFRSMKELAISSFGVPEPEKRYIRPVEKEDIDIVIVPGVAFNEEGYRLGYGGGYYDRFLKTLPDRCLTIGLAFEMQIVRNLPIEQHDMKVDMIITDQRVLLF